jgi:hypothetical protein
MPGFQPRLAGVELNRLGAAGWELVILRRAHGAPVPEARSAVTRTGAYSGQRAAAFFAALSLLSCSSPPRAVLAGEIPLDVRVRVTAPNLPPGWHRGRLIESDERCRVVTVATARQRDPLLLLNMGQISRLQVSQANPPPDWWTEPEEREGWSEIDMTRLHDETDRCRHQYPSDVHR